MDLVLGLSMTSAAVRWVLVEGTTGEGAPIDRGTLPIDASAAFDADGLLNALLYDQGRLAENDVHAIGVTWTTEAEAAATSLLQALAEHGLGNVVAVSDIESAEALACGIADISGYHEVAVCVVEPDCAVVAVVNPAEVTVERIDRPLDRADAIELTSSVIAMLELDDRAPDAIFVVGSEDVDVLVSSLAAITTAPVISAAEADLALARGAALASALAVNMLDGQLAPERPRWMSKVGALSAVLAAAAVTFVVSLSVAVGLRLTPDYEQPQNANAADKPAPMAIPPSVAQAAPQPPRPAAPPIGPPPEAAPSETMAEAAPDVPEVAVPEPVYDPPAAAPVVPPPVYQPIAPPPVAPPPPPAYVPPAPNYLPPANPVPTPATSPQPRLRDRIIERIPLINRFHEPQYPYP